MQIKKYFSKYILLFVVMFGLSIDFVIASCFATGFDRENIIQTNVGGENYCIGIINDHKKLTKEEELQLKRNSLLIKIQQNKKGITYILMSNILEYLKSKIECSLERAAQEDASYEEQKELQQRLSELCALIGKKPKDRTAFENTLIQKYKEAFIKELNEFNIYEITDSSNNSTPQIPSPKAEKNSPKTPPTNFIGSLNGISIGGEAQTPNEIIAIE